MSGFSIETLKGQISQSGGLAMKNQFRVTLPQIESFPIDARELDVMCTTTSLPGRQIMSQDVPIGTVQRKIANGYATTDMSMTFLVANNHLIRQYFEAWQNEAHDIESKTVGYFEDYTYPVKIETVERGLRMSLFKKQIGFMDRVPSVIRNRLPDIGPLDLSSGQIDLGASFDMKTTYTCTLLECYPTSLTEQMLSNGEEGFMELTVQLSYTDWESEKGEFTSEGESFGRGVAGAIGSLIGRALG
jgi:hypothetical protein